MKPTKEQAIKKTTENRRHAFERFRWQLEGFLRYDHEWILDTINHTPFSFSKKITDLIEQEGFKP